MTSSTSPDGRVWVVYTTDRRFPFSPTRFDSAFVTEKLAQDRAAALNAEETSPESVVFSNVVPLLPRAEAIPAVDKNWDY